MCASPLSFLRSGPPPPRVVLLADALFFTRAVPVTAGASAAEAATQVELALEGIAPFPLTQLYYGWFWRPHAEQALVFAAYRRRFTTEQMMEWGEAELVLPTFAALLGAEVEAGTTVVFATVEGVTAVHWSETTFPSRVCARSLEPDATDDERAAARAEVIRACGDGARVIELTAPVTAVPATSDREVVFRAGDFVSRLTSSQFAAIDVRDKAEFDLQRRARRRDVAFWRLGLACIGLLVLLGLGELALMGGRVWQTGRTAKVRAQKPTVDTIMSSQSLANRIEELATKRLLPFEMINVLFEDNRKPAEIIFQRVVTQPQTGLYTLTIDASATNAAQVSVYEATLRKLPMIQRVEVRDFRTRGETATFTLVVTFKPDTVKPAESLAQ